jgi:hypothetical protein
MAAQPQPGLLGCARMRARPVGPAQSSALHDFARSGPTKEAHRRAMNRSGGLLRSGASDQGKRAEADASRSPPPGGPIRGGVGGPIRGGIRGSLEGPIRGDPEGPRNHCRASWRLPEIAGGNSATGRVWGPKSARRGRDPAPGRIRPMPSPDGNTTRPDKAPGSRSFVLGRRLRPAGKVGGPGGLRALHLDPGVGPDGPGDTGRPFRSPRSGARRARALPRRLTTVDTSRSEHHALARGVSVSCR